MVIIDIILGFIEFLKQKGIDPGSKYFDRAMQMVTNPEWNTITQIKSIGNDNSFDSLLSILREDDIDPKYNIPVNNVNQKMADYEKQVAAKLDEKVRSNNVTNKHGKMIPDDPKSIIIKKNSLKNKSNNKKQSAKSQLSNLKPKSKTQKVSEAVVSNNKLITKQLNYLSNQNKI